MKSEQLFKKNRTFTGEDHAPPWQVSGLAVHFLAQARGFIVFMLLILTFHPEPLSAADAEEVLGVLVDYGAITMRTVQLSFMESLEIEIAAASGYEGLLRIKRLPDGEDMQLLVDYYRNNRKQLSGHFDQDTLLELDSLLLKDNSASIRPESKNTAPAGNMSGLSGFLELPDTGLKPEGCGSVSFGYRLLDHRWGLGDGWQTFWPVAVRTGDFEFSVSEVVSHFHGRAGIRNSTGEGLAFKYVPCPGIVFSGQGYFPNTGAYRSEREYLIGFQRKLKSVTGVLALGMEHQQEWENFFHPGLSWDMGHANYMLLEWRDNDREYRFGLRRMTNCNTTLSYTGNGESRMKIFQLSWELPFK
ncbi:MAG: hypothetical protein PHQ23_04950 [Candidatus Wallbacteria bacterium]|nr:hypothetical protein [Candidatus Wallbacteria bacterium]